MTENPATAGFSAFRGAPGLPWRCPLTRTLTLQVRLPRWHARPHRPGHRYAVDVWRERRLGHSSSGNAAAAAAVAPSSKRQLASHPYRFALLISTSRHPDTPRASPFRRPSDASAQALRRRLSRRNRWVRRACGQAHPGQSAARPARRRRADVVSQRDHVHARGIEPDRCPSPDCFPPVAVPRRRRLQRPWTASLADPTTANTAGGANFADSALA